VGRTHLGILHPQPQLRSGQPVQTLFHGDLHSINGQPPRKERSDNDAIANLYREFDLSFTSHVEGACCISIVDARRRRVVIATVLVCRFPLYWTEVNGTLIFASELPALLRTHAVPHHLDARAIADYITFGFPFGTTTLAEGVRLLAAGSTLVYEWDTGTASVQQFAEIQDAFRPSQGTQVDYTDAVCHEFERSVTRALSGTHEFGLSLSGGLDSRAILSAVNGHCSELATYTL